METNLICATTGEPCWNIQALRRYARAMTKQEIVFESIHHDIDLQPGEIACEGIVENEHGLGKVCLPSINPSVVVYQDSVLEIEGNVRCLREIKGFKLVKPDGSPWDKQFNGPKT